MKSLPLVLIVVAVLGVAAACTQPQKEITLTDATEKIRAFAESQNPALRDQPLVLTLARKKGGGGVCICIQVCTKGGTCTGCVCDPAGCSSCVAAADVAPVDSVFGGVLR